MIQIEIRTDNDAFYDMGGTYDPGAEVARILREQANLLEIHWQKGDHGVRDMNGNTVGTVTITATED
jgi:hypothetical protein